MRIYIPATALDLSSASIAPRVVHAVTPAAKRAFPDEDLESLEMLATLYAADDSLIALRRSASASNNESHADMCSWRRIVLVGEVPDTWVASIDARACTVSGCALESDVASGADEHNGRYGNGARDSNVNDLPPTAVELTAPVLWDRIESIHIDEACSENEELVRRALSGDDAAFEATGDLELLWYDVTERDSLVAELS